MNKHWWQRAMPDLDGALLEAAKRRQAQLTKPPGSLGRLEVLGATLAAMQKTQHPQLKRVQITVFAADHGVVAEGVSAYPQAVTAEMVRNFARGGAAISVLAQEWQARLEVVNVGTVRALEALPDVLDRRLGPGTANFTRDPAMTSDQLHKALAVGYETAERAADQKVQLFIGGDMGIGNTTSATALSCALLTMPATSLTGAGTGLNAAGMAHKARVITMALTRYQNNEPLEALRCVGGFEIAALTGAYLRCGQLRIPVLIDGFITTVAALIALRLQPRLAPWLFYAHRSTEPAHRHLLEAIKAEPLLDLEMRLGEGSGAAVALPLLRAAAALHARMATFAEAGISMT